MKKQYTEYFNPGMASKVCWEKDWLDSEGRNIRTTASIRTYIDHINVTAEIFTSEESEPDLGAFYDHYAHGIKPKGFSFPLSIYGLAHAYLYLKYGLPEYSNKKEVTWGKVFDYMFGKELFKGTGTGYTAFQVDHWRDPKSEDELNNYLEKGQMVCPPLREIIKAPGREYFRFLANGFPIGALNSRRLKQAVHPEWPKLSDRPIPVHAE